MFPLHDDNPTRSLPFVTFAIIVLNLIALLSTYALTDEQQQQLVLHRGFVPARIAQLRNQQPIDLPIDRLAKHPHLPVVVKFRGFERLEADAREIVTSLVSSMFLHAGWAHFIGNMWFLLVFGNNIEDRLGHVLYAGFYVLGGLIAMGVHWLQDPQSLVPVIGASGAVSAVLGAYVVTFPHARVKTLIFLFVFVTIAELPALVVLGIWFLGQLLNATQAVGLGMTGGVAWWAHIGGFLAGMALMALINLTTGALKEEQSDRDRFALPDDLNERYRAP